MYCARLSLKNVKTIDVQKLHPQQGREVDEVLAVQQHHQGFPGAEDFRWIFNTFLRLSAKNFSHLVKYVVKC
jgi:hypothetical protein